MGPKARVAPVALLIVLLAASAAVGHTDAGEGPEMGLASARMADPVLPQVASFSSDLENFSLTAKFLTTLQISGGANDGGIKEAEDNPYDNTDNTLESVWLWSRYEALTGDQRYRGNSQRAWAYSMSSGHEAWQETDSGKIYSSGWCVLAYAEYAKVVGSNAQYKTYSDQCSSFIATNNGMEDTSWGANERQLIRGWGAGALYTYAKEMGDATARVAALRIGNDTKAALTSTPSLAKTEAWALSGGAMVYGVATSTLVEFPDDPWLRNIARTMDTYVPVAGSGAGRSQNGWEAWYALGFDATWRVLKDDMFYENARNITNNLVRRDADRDGGIPTNILDPPNTDESWVTNYRAYFALRPALENAANATLKGVVKDSISGAPIAGAKVTANDNVSSYSASATSDAAGAYSITLPPQIYQVGAGAAGYNASGNSKVVLPPGSSKTVDFALKRSGGGGNDTQPPVIIHNPVTPVVEATPVPISMMVTDNVGVATVTVHHRLQGNGSWKSDLAQNGIGNDYSFTIPSAEVTPPAVEYYIGAADSSANKALSPASGGTAPYVIKVVPKGGGNDTTPPVISHVPPSPVVEGTAIQIVATVTDNVGIGSVTVHFRMQGQGTWQSGSAQNGGGNDYSFTVPSAEVMPPGVEYYIEAADTSANKATSPTGGASSPYVITVTPKGGGGDTTPPVISHVPPGPVVEGTPVLIVATVADNIGVLRADVVYQWKGGPWTSLPAQKGSGDSYSATIPASDVRTPSIEYAVKAADAATNTASSPSSGDPHSIKVLPKPAPPRVVSTDPPAGGSGVALDAVIVVTFSEDMDPTATRSAFSISPTVAGTLSGSDTVLTFAPAAPLSPLTTYRVTISTQAKDLDGASLVQPFEFSFTTRDVVPPPCAGCGTYPFYATPLGIGLVVTLIALVAIGLLFLMRRRRKEASPRSAPAPWQDPSQQPWQQAQQWQYQHSQQDPFSQQPPWNRP